MGDALPFILLLFLFGGGGSKGTTKKPSGQCTEDSTVNYTGPRLYPDSRPKQDDALSVTERTSLGQVLSGLQAGTFLSLAKGDGTFACTRESLAALFGFAGENSELNTWVNIIAMIVFSESHDSSYRQYEVTSGPEKIRINLIASAVTRHLKPLESGTNLDENDDDDDEDDDANADKGGYPYPVCPVAKPGCATLIKKGDSLLGMVEKLYPGHTAQERLGIARTVVAHPANTFARVASESTYNKANFPAGVLGLLPRYSVPVNGVEQTKGVGVGYGSFPRIFWPPVI